MPMVSCATMKIPFSGPQKPSYARFTLVGITFKRIANTVNREILAFFVKEIFFKNYHMHKQLQKYYNMDIS